MANNLSDIVTVNVDIASPAVDSASFDNLLIVGPGPKVTPPQPLPDVGVYTELPEVTAAGFVSTGANADPVGIAAMIAFSQNPKPAQIYIAVQKVVTSVVEPAIDTLTRALETSGWYVICAAGIDPAEYEPIAAWTEAQAKLFSYTFLTQTDPVGGTYFRSHGWCGLVNDLDIASTVPIANAYLHVAAVAKCLSYLAGSETWSFKQLGGITPSNLSGTLKKALVDGHSNYFAQYAGRNITMNGQVRTGEWIDVVRGRDWLQNDMQIRLYNLLIMNPKIPYTNSGISLVQSEMIASLKEARDRGIVAQDEYGGDGALVPGFTTSVPNSLDITATQKASRILSGCRFSARLAGAIHMVQVNGTLTY